MTWASVSRQNVLLVATPRPSLVSKSDSGTVQRCAGEVAPRRGQNPRPRALNGLDCAQTTRWKTHHPMHIVTNTFNLFELSAIRRKYLTSIFRDGRPKSDEPQTIAAAKLDRHRPIVHRSAMALQLKKAVVADNLSPPMPPSSMPRAMARFNTPGAHVLY